MFTSNGAKSNWEVDHDADVCIVIGNAGEQSLWLDQQDLENMLEELKKAKGEPEENYFGGYDGPY